MIKNRFRLARLDVRPVRWPLRWRFATALGAKTHTDNIIVRARLSGGAIGYGEASSSLAMAFQTPSAMAAALRRLGRDFRGVDVRDTEAVIASAWKRERPLPSAAAAFECALWDALARACGIPFVNFWGGLARSELETSLSVPVAPAEWVGAFVRRFARRGFRLFKLKLNGREPSLNDLSRLRQAHRAAPRARFLADPNQSYTPDGLAELLYRAERLGIGVELVEEPFRKRNWSAYASLPSFPRPVLSGAEGKRAAPRRHFLSPLGACRVCRTGPLARPESSAGRSHFVPVILDESIQSPEEAEFVARRRLARGVNVKLAKSGLVKGRRILSAFQGTPSSVFMIGCMAESKVGLAAAVHWACAMDAFDYVDLDSDLFVAARGVRGGFERRGPKVVLPRRLPPGLGIKWDG